jgi:hypothetical protein
MKKLLNIVIVSISFVTCSFGQDNQGTQSGTVTFVTSNNVYVKFDTTDSIAIGDELFFNGSPCLKVSEKSSSSVVCALINDCVIDKDATITHISIKDVEITTEAIEGNVDEIIPAETVQPKEPPESKKSLYNENVRGRISLASYNNFSNLRENRHRLLTRFSLNANHINDGKFSIESNLAYRSELETPPNYSGRTSIFNIYNLNGTYEATPSLSVSLGRKINAKASTFGANDGLQVEKYFGNFYLGGVVGFRPDFQDYGFNSDLLQYGGYMGIESSSENFYSTTTLGAMEQTNAGATDRRYLFLQHSSTINNNLNIFSSMEMDIFGNSGTSTRLTNLFLSARYRFSRAVNLMVSYDSRKRIIYYETFQNDIERILDEDLARQGIRVRINVRPIKVIWAGASYNTRFQGGDQNKSDNIYGYVTLTKIPKLGGSINVSYSMNSSRYLNSNIFAARHSRQLVKNKLSADFYFRMADYDYKNQSTQYKQNYYGLQLGYSISRSWQLSFSSELATLDQENSMRFYTQLTKRFYSKKKK